MKFGIFNKESYPNHFRFLFDKGIYLEYLKHCRVSIYFIETPQNEIPRRFETNAFHFAETETALDIPEGYDPEM